MIFPFIFTLHHNLSLYGLKKETEKKKRKLKVESTRNLIKEYT